MDTSAAESPSSLAALFPSLAMARLVIFFAVRPGGRFHLRELMRRTCLSNASLQREMRRLVAVGAVVRHEDGGRVYFSADEAHDAWRGWILLLRSAAAPSDVLREALVDAQGLTGAFVFGSAARGDGRSDSDVDLFLLVDDEARIDPVRRQLGEAELLIGKPLDVVEYTTADARRRAGSGNAFLTRVLREPRRWIYGDATSLTDEETE